MNMTEPAVSKSPRTIETVTAVASRTATESFPQSSALSPSRIYLTERKAEMTARTGSGRKSLENVRRRTVMASLSSYSRFRARGVCAGTRSIASAFWNENAAKRAKNGCAVFLEADHRVTRAVKDLNIQNARNIFQIILQKRLPDAASYARRPGAPASARATHAESDISYNGILRGTIQRNKGRVVRPLG